MKQSVFILLTLMSFFVSVEARPLSLHSEDETNTTVQLKWVLSGSGVTSQSVKQKIGWSYQTIATLAPGVSEYNVTSLTPYTTYTFKVCDYNSVTNNTECSIDYSVSTTHTWESPLRDCLNNVDDVPKRTQLLEQTQIICASQGLTEIEPVRDLKNLQVLYIPGNNFSVPFPTWIGELDKLTSINIAENNFTGSLPSGIGNLASLKTLNCTKNHLNGSLPESIGNLSQLETLDLYDNDMSGSLPDSIGGLISLKGLELSYNDFSGHLPETLGSLSSLEFLVLKHNRFEGPLPDSIGNLENLHVFLAYYNHFSGPLPESIGNLSNLTLLNLTHNNFYGSIPHSFGRLSQLHSLSIAYNDLSGKIPTEINEVNMPNLDDGTGIVLIGNCALYADSESIPFIDAKSSGIGNHPGYDGIIETNTHHCFIPALVPITSFLLE